MKFQPQRLISLRNKLGISKAEAARRLNMSAMGYGRYETGERVPSFQVVSFIAQTLGTSTDYLYGETNSELSDTITISYKDNPDLFLLVKAYQNNADMAQRLLSDYKKIII